jgi:hydrogenase 3 maturation protease
VKPPPSLLHRLGSGVLFVGMGNVLRSDDGVGVRIAQELPPSDRYRVLVVETGLENYVGKIRSLRPSVLVLIDCAHFGREPGYCGWLEAGRTVDLSTTTHNLSLSRFPDFFDFPVHVLGIQPASLKVGEHLSSEVAGTARALVGMIARWGAREGEKHARNPVSASSC